MDVHKKVFNETVVAIKEEPDENSHVEMTEILTDLDSVAEGELLNDTKGKNINFDWFIDVRQSKKSPAFSKTSGDTVYVSVILDSSTATADVGIVTADNVFIYVPFVGQATHTFSISTSGTYRLLIRNTSSSIIEAEGFYR